MTDSIGYPYYIGSQTEVLCDRGGGLHFYKRPKRGLPSGALVFRSEHEASNELGWERDRIWPGIPSGTRVYRLQRLNQGGAHDPGIRIG